MSSWEFYAWLADSLLMYLLFFHPFPFFFLFFLFFFLFQGVRLNVLHWEDTLLEAAIGAVVQWYRA
jgi:hypothetical protein